MMFRIQKLIMTEYSDFEETVLIEGPFAEVRENGIGIQAVQIGLTATKLIIGTEVFIQNSSETLNTACNGGRDPEIETMELLKVLPLELIYLKVLQKGTRRVLKITTITNKTMLFEFGGHLLRQIHYNIWRDQICFMRSFLKRSLPPDQVISSATTTSLETISEPKLVKAQIHHQNSSTRSLSKSDYSRFRRRRQSLLELFNRVPKFSRSSQKTDEESSLNASNDEYLSESQGLLLKDIAEYFLETRSEIIGEKFTSDSDECGGRCQGFMLKSMSFDAIGDCRRH